LHKELISLIVINYNGAKYLPALIRSLLEQSYDNYELIIWDNNSTDHSTTLIESMQLECITLIKHYENIGFAEANNRALQHCSGEYIMLLNNDTQLDRSCLRLLHAAIEDHDVVAPIILFYHPHVSITLGPHNEIDQDSLTKLYDSFPHIIHNDNLLSPSSVIRTGDIIKIPHSKINHEKPDPDQSASIRQFKKSYTEVLDMLDATCLELCDIINSTGLLINHRNGKASDRGIFSVYDPDTINCTPSAFSGCCFMVKRELIKQYGLFDAKLFMYYEDVDFFWRLNQISTPKLKLVNKAVIRHDFRSTNRLIKKYYIDRNRLVVLSKYGRRTLTFMAFLSYFIYVIKQFLTRSESRTIALRAFIDSTLKNP